MTDCLNEEMRDRLPLLGSDALDASETAAARVHLAGCAACREELRAVEFSRAVLTAAAPRVDVGAIVAALPAPRLHVVVGSGTGARGGAVERQGASAARRAGFRRSRPYLAAAASLLIVASLASPLLTGVFRESTPGGVPDTSLTVAGPESPVSTPPAFPSTPVAAVHGIAMEGGLSDLSDDALSALLSELDAIEATVATEPVTLRRAIVETPGESR